MKIIVLAGGLSPERDVSLSSGALIANALIESGHDILLLDLLVGSKEKYEDIHFFSKKEKQKYESIIPMIEPDLLSLRKKYKNEIGENIIDICKKADCVFIALHGDLGENGKLQALFDINHISYTGTGYIGCLLAMDKDISKKLAKQEEILTAQWRMYDLEKTTVSKIIQEIDVPCVIKPLSCGSSVGVSIVENANDLGKALNEASKYEKLVLIEEKISGVEVSCGVIDNKAMPVIEIRPIEGFYNYRNKYQKGLVDEICPAEISIDIARRIQEASVKMHKALRLGYYSRSDFIIDKNNRIYYLESNTLPGMTPTSLLPQEASVAGISYRDLCERIVENRIRN